jgi:hypothetical protein
MTARKVKANLSDVPLWDQVKNVVRLKCFEKMPMGSRALPRSANQLIVFALNVLKEKELVGDVVKAIEILFIVCGNGVLAHG